MTSRPDVRRTARSLGPAHRRPRSLIAAAAVLVVVVVAGAACSDDEQGDATSTTADPAAAGTADDVPAAEPSDPDSEYCTVAAEIRGQRSSMPEDADAAQEQVDQIERLAAASPPEVRDAVERYAETFRQLAEVPEEDPAAFGEVLALLISPELSEASRTIDVHTRSACGFGFGEDR